MMTNNYKTATGIFYAYTIIYKICIYANSPDLHFKEAILSLISIGGFIMKKNELKLLSSRAINKIGNFMI